MRVSEYYRLGANQDELDFVNVDVVTDTQVYIDPSALRNLDWTWAQECISLIQSFFQHVLNAIRSGDDTHAVQLLCGLSEPNETHLGMSTAASRGRGMGFHAANDVWNALRKSNAVRSGLLSDIEDSLLFIEGIGTDIISDMVTNIIREPLIIYTQGACRYYGIGMKEVDSGPLWNPVAGRWSNRFMQLPMASEQKLLLVPKVVVRRKPDYDAEEYNRNYILTYLQAEEIKARSELVRLLKDGTPKVTKKDVAQKYGTGKETNTNITLQNPELLRQYRYDKETTPNPPLSHQEMAEATHSEPVDWDALLQEVTSLPTGATHATAYEIAIQKLLSALFYPSLVNPVRQAAIHEGRKRLDILFTNLGQDAFFHWLSKHFPAANIVVECKNYSDDIANPELDQMIGRFSMSRGKVGFLICRQVDDRELLDHRCRDAAHDGQGFVIALDDQDLTQMVDAQKRGCPSEMLKLLRDKFNALVM